MGTGQRFKYRPPVWALICAVVLIGGVALLLHTLHEQQHVAQAAAQRQFKKRQPAMPVEAVAAATHAVGAASLSLTLSPPPPPPSPSSSPSPSPVESGRCVPREHLEYDGDVVIWGPSNMRPSAAACCESCHEQRERATARGEAGCTVWVFCGKEGGCGTQKQGECWGKKGAKPVPTVRARGPGCDWTSGEAMSAAEAAEMKAAADALVAVEVERRERPSNPRVFFDVAINGEPHGRIEFVLYAKESPRHAENFRAMCTGERGGKLTFKGMKFYRIIDMFIDQAGVQGAASIWGGSFDDDPGGLQLKHDRSGLLSAANGGPNTNSGHFSVVVSPAPHLNGGYTVFGEVVAGFETMWAINKLTTKGTDRVTGTALVTEAGCLKSCEPRPEVGPKCKTRAETKSMVQGRPVNACLD